ncbi:MAG TPA: phosphoenolpyruvate carboxykinase domain-containing protein [Chloroflexota bacterium]|nr:phosphoenolpyruvate carboxykinase domain-containing protein [Chloroflexota bacterium]
MGDKLGSRAPRIFYVNWFRKTREGKWLWPGYGENSRVLKWMCDRVDGRVDAVNTPIGLLPNPSDLELAGLDISQEELTELLRVDKDAWRSEIPDIEQHFAKFGDRMPARLTSQLYDLQTRLG